MSEDPAKPVPQLKSLLADRWNWQRWLSGVISIALFIAIIVKLKDFGFAKAAATLPASPLFWLAFIAYYFAGSTGEWIIFRRLWGLPFSGFLALLRKLVSNEVLLGYSGEAYFYSWARRHSKIVTAPFGAIKDVSILSAIAGNLMTLTMLAVAWPLVGHVTPNLHPRAVALSAALMIGTSMLIFLFKNRIFSLPRRELWMIFGVHSARILATTLMIGIMWNTALPQVPLILLILLATLQLLVGRLPFVPSKELVFANLAVFVIGHDSEVATLIRVIATLILATHLVIGAILVVEELFEERET
jgi:hypothetical protein